MIKGILKILLGLAIIKFVIIGLFYLSNFKQYSNEDICFNQLNNNSKINSVFVGSSRTKSGISTFQFDDSTQLKTYNSGVSSAFSPLTFQFVESIMRHKKYQNIFIELSYPHKFCNIHFTRWEKFTGQLSLFYFQTSKDLSFKNIVKIFWISKYEIETFCQEFFAFRYYVRFFFGVLSDSNLTFDNYGNYTNYPPNDSLLTEESIVQLKIKYEYLNSNNDSNSNNYFKSQLTQIIENATKHDCKIYFYLPCSPSELELYYIRGVINNLPKENVLKLNDVAIDSIFKKSNFYNDGHLNALGRKQFTNALSQSYLEHFNSNSN